MNPILQRVAEFLKSKQFRYSIAEDGAALCFCCNGKHLVWSTMANTDEEASALTFLSRVPVRIPASKRRAAAQLIARLNYGKRHGSFHLDLRDGEVLFCASNFVAGLQVPEEVLEGLTGTTFAAMDQGGPEFLKLLYASGSKATADIPGRFSGGPRRELN